MLNNGFEEVTKLTDQIGEDLIKNYSERLNQYFERLNNLSGGRINIVRRSFERFAEMRGSQGAASLAYFAFFSLFSLLLVLVSIGGFILGNKQANQLVKDAITQAIPVSQDLILRNLESVLELRGTVGIIGLITLLWSASGFFTTLAFNVNMAWGETQPRNFFKARLVGLLMVASLGVLMLLSLIINAVLEVLPRLQIPILGDLSVYDSSLWGFISNLSPWFMILFLFIGLYRWVPSTEVSWWGAIISALFAATGWRIATGVFAWYLASGFGQYDIVYGSLGAVVVLIFLIYLINWITLFGAHLASSIDHWRLERAG